MFPTREGVEGDLEDRLYKLKKPDTKHGTLYESVFMSRIGRVIVRK